MLRTILVPLDGSPVAEPGLTAACRLARSTGALLSLLRATPPLSGEPAPQAGEGVALQEAAEYLHGVQHDLRRAGFEVCAEALPGEPAETILAAAQTKADLISLCTQGYGGTGHVLLGSVAEAVLRAAPVPVLLAPAAVEIVHQESGPRHVAHTPLAGAPFHRILVPLDGTPFAEAALAYLARGGLGRGAEVILLRVLEPAALPAAANLACAEAVVRLHEQADRERERRRLEAHTYLSATACAWPLGSWRALVVPGYPAREILEVARVQCADLILMASHGPAESDGLLQGRVAAEVVRHAEAPVLVLRGAAASAADHVPAPGGDPWARHRRDQGDSSVSEDCLLSR